MSNVMKFESIISGHENGNSLCLTDLRLISLLFFGTKEVPDGKLVLVKVDGDLFRIGFST